MYRLCLLVIILVTFGCDPPAMKTGVDGIRLPETFEIQKIKISREGQGSWISMAFGPDGSLYVSPEKGDLLRFPPNAEGSFLGDAEVIEFPIGRAQGLCWAFDSLYVNVAGNADSDGGLHRLRDNDFDGVFEEHAYLVPYGPASEHGAHAIVDGGDGWLYTVWGNHVKIPFDLISSSSPFQNFSEDVLLPSILDPRGHAHGKTMPAGTFWRFKPDGTNWELLSGGMRNAYDVAMTSDGHWFAYDSDMEWDIGTPWYRPPRLLHLVPGGDYGWRTGSAKLDPSYPDTLPSVVDTDFASPTGMISTHLLAGQDDYGFDLLIADWAYGRLLGVNLEGVGASFVGEVDVFAEGRPWNISDIESGPDGALWVLTGGRGTPSNLYRIAPRDGKILNLASKGESKFYDSKSKFYDSESSNAFLLQTRKLLGSQDRWTRWRARIAWENSIRNKFNDDALDICVAPSLSAAEMRLAIARTQPQLASHIWNLLFTDGWLETREVQLIDLRVAHILLSRHGEDIDSISRHRVHSQVALCRDLLNIDARRLADELLVFLGDTDLPTLLTPLLSNDNSWEAQIYAAYLLRLVSDTWAADTRLKAADWARRALSAPGGASLEGFLQKISADLRAVSGSEEWDSIVKTKLPPLESSDWQQPIVSRPFVEKWTLESALGAIKGYESFASAQNGYEILAEANCLSCHRFNSNGKGLGPDLTGVGRRFDRQTVLDSIINPQKVVSDQYLNLPMPSGLLDYFTAAEIADLILLLELGAR